MNKTHYIRDVADRAGLKGEKRRRLTDDLGQRWEQLASQGYNNEEIIRQMGDPDDLGREIYEGSVIMDGPARHFVEYRAKRELFGMPLVHVVLPNRDMEDKQGRVARPMPRARGILAIGRQSRGLIAIGASASGLIAIGNFAVGLLAIGNIGIGVLSLANIGLALLIAVANVGFGALAAGNLAVGWATAGNMSAGYYAVGNGVTGAVAYGGINQMPDLSGLQSFIQQLPQPARGWLSFAYPLVTDFMLFVILMTIMFLALIASQGIKRILQDRLGA